MVGGDSVGLILMVGGGGRATDVERALRRARQAAARDLLNQAQNIPQLSPLIVVTDDAEWGATLDGLSVRLELTEPGADFHFGRSLVELVERHGLHSCFYVGGGSAPLMSDADWARVVRAVQADRPVLVTNNIHSSDWAAFAPADAVLPLVRWLERDNALPWVWREKTDLPVQVLERSTATQMDIDTPFDLLALARHPGVQPHLRAFLDTLDWPTAKLDAALAVLQREASHVIIAGRVSTWTWRLLEQYTRVWVRVFAEERGMRASGRQATGAVRSLLNDYLDLVGVDSFFSHLGEMADAILLDSRVILASRGLWPSDADRFHADLLMDAEIEEPFLRALAAAARAAPVPVVMGGHSLVAGGLAVLLEGIGIVPIE
jgi:CTP:molybdopterin cytidylyltransferase MocA